MKITPRNLIRHEFIGLKAEIIDSYNKYYIGISGLIVGETRNTVLILGNDGKIRRIPKALCTFLITLPSGLRVKVNGQVIIGRPEDRLKRVSKRW